jgi:hypothetical protein
MGTVLTFAGTPLRDGARPHPRAIQLAIATIGIAAKGRGVCLSDFRAAGFTAAEFFRHAPEAELILSQGKPTA